MTRPHIPVPGSRSLARERRRRARRRGVLLLLSVLLLAGVGVMAASGSDDGRTGARDARGGGSTAYAGQTALGPLPLSVDLSRRDRVRGPFKRPPRGGLLVNLDTGEVLWRRRPTRALPIASVTKMMTALIVTESLRPDDKARITKAVLNYSGTGVGVLPRGKRVKVETLLYGLMLPSGNDAARALAFRVSGSIRGFVERMNARAAQLGLRCTRFASPEGLDDRGRSCPVDLAVIARRVLDNRRLAKIVRTRRARLPMAIKGGRVEMWSHNPLLREGYPGVIGVKTGYTSRAGRCFVAAARRRGVRLAAIVLDSPDPGRQTRRLLDRGFRATR